MGQNPTGTQSAATIRLRQEDDAATMKPGDQILEIGPVAFGCDVPGELCRPRLTIVLTGHAQVLGKVVAARVLAGHVAISEAGPPKYRHPCVAVFLGTVKT